MAQATFSDWITQEVVPKLKILHETVGHELGQAALEAFIASPSNGISPFVYWQRERSAPSPTLSASHVTNPSLAASSFSKGPQPLPEDGPGSLRHKAGALGVELYDAGEGLPARYKAGSYLDPEDFTQLNAQMRANGWNWKPGFKAWVRQ